LPVLLDELRQVLSDEPAFVLLTCHDARWPALTLAEALEGLLDGKGARSQVEQGSMVLRAAERPGRDLPMGEYARWKRTL
jgi:23S rRNA (cytosine1962-C5)-methyltransferase